MAKQIPTSFGNELFPVFFKLNNLKVLVVGGGYVGLEKTRAILSNSPATELSILALDISSELKQFVADFPRVKLIEKWFEPADVEGFQLVVGALNDEAVSLKVRQAASENSILCNIADKPELCDFYLGSVVKKGDLKIAISTNGKSPTIAKRVKEVLTESFPDEINESIHNLNAVRDTLRGDFTEKVKQLNQITAVLSEDLKPRKQFLITPIWLFFFGLGVVAAFVSGFVFSIYFSPQLVQQLFQQTLESVNFDTLSIIVVGFLAQVVDGALGMAYGLTATSFLLSIGISPAVSSASVHASEVFTSGISGLMHLKFGNVNKRLFKSLVIPGVIGAVLGAYILTSLQQYNHFIKPITSTYTLLLGVYILVKAFSKSVLREKVKRIYPIALLGGFLDSSGGGGWGPIVTSSLIAGGRNVRYAIGSVNLTEFFVSAASSFTFFALIGFQHWGIIVALILGGTIAAPLGAILTKHIPSKFILVMVGVVVILLSLKRIFLG